MYSFFFFPNDNDSLKKKKVFSDNEAVVLSHQDSPVHTYTHTKNTVIVRSLPFKGNRKINMDRKPINLLVLKSLSHSLLINLVHNALDSLE